MTSTSTFDSTLASLGIKTTGGTSSAGAATKNTSKLGSTNMNENDFLKLLTAQLQNQDPFNPTDNNQMVSQMAQFSQLSGITDMSSTLKSIADKLNNPSLSDTLGYVGKNVLTQGSTAYARTSGGIAGAVDLDADASDVKVTIQSASGATLKTIDLGKQSAGTISYDWDGTTDSGAAAGDGPYSVKVAATNGSGAVSAKSLVWAPIESAALNASGAPVLNALGIGQISISDIRQIG